MKINSFKLFLSLKRFMASNLPPAKPNFFKEKFQITSPQVWSWINSILSSLDFLWCEFVWLPYEASTMQKMRGKFEKTSTKTCVDFIKWLSEWYFRDHFLQHDTSRMNFKSYYVLKIVIILKQTHTHTLLLNHEKENLCTLNKAKQNHNAYLTNKTRREKWNRTQRK